MIVYGFHPVREALRHRPAQVSRVLVGATRGGRRRREIETLCARLEVACERARESDLARLAPGVHNGFVAELEGDGASAGGADRDLVVLVEDVQDPRNLGALLRVCEGAGVGEVLIRDRGSAPLSPTVAKTAAGALEWLTVERVTSSARAIATWKAEGFWVYGTAPLGELPWHVDLGGKVALCFGGEERGLRARTLALCDRVLALPMRGHLASLNLATAAAAVLYEAVRQREKGPARPS